LQKDIAQFGAHPIQSVFIGGGTPSLFPSAMIASLMDGINTLLSLSPKTEITLEANPGTLDEKEFVGYKAAGVNRLSIGVQSFQDKHLQRLGRIHDSDAALKTIDTAFRAGFKKVNIDIMYGLVHQTTVEAMADLRVVLNLPIQHLSWYQLTLEPNTVFYSSRPVLPADKRIDEIESQGKAMLTDAGLMAYEISAYAKPSHECLHNLNYWQFGDYYGIGAGAHGKLTDPFTHQITRTQKTRLPNHYLDNQRPYLAKETRIEAHDIPFEFFLNAFRLYQPMALTLFEERTGLSRNDIAPQVAFAKAEGLIRQQDGFLETTKRGKRYLNDLINCFMPTC